MSALTPAAIAAAEALPERARKALRAAELGPWFVEADAVGQGSVVTAALWSGDAKRRAIPVNPLDIVRAAMSLQDPEGAYDLVDRVTELDDWLDYLGTPPHGPGFEGLPPVVRDPDLDEYTAALLLLAASAEGART